MREAPAPRFENALFRWVYEKNNKDVSIKSAVYGTTASGYRRRWPRAHRKLKD